MQKSKSHKFSQQKKQGLPFQKIRSRKRRTDEATSLFPFLQLQKTIGNQVVGRILQAKLKVGR